MGCQRVEAIGPHQDFAYRMPKPNTRSRSKWDVGPFAKANWHPRGADAAAGKAAEISKAVKRSGRRQKAADEGSKSSGTQKGSGSGRQQPQRKAAKNGSGRQQRRAANAAEAEGKGS